MSRWHARLIAAAVCVSISGCSLLQPPPDRDPVPDLAPTRPEVPAEPVTEHRWQYSAATQQVIGTTQVLRTRDTDTISDIARSYDLGYDEIRQANPEVDPWLPGVDTEVLLPTRFILPDARRTGIVLNIAAKRLYVHEPAAEGDGFALTTYPIGIGRVGWATPTGEATVIDKATDPSWYVPASVRAEHRAAGDPLPAVVAPGPDNPLGRHVLKLDMPGYLLHGTNQPYGVGMRVSHGCVRLYPEDIEVLFASTDRGTDVTIVNQPFVAGREGDALWIAAYPILEDDERSMEQLLSSAIEYLTERHGAVLNESMIAAVSAVIERADGMPMKLESGALVADMAMPVRNIAQLPEDAPSRAEVSEMLEALMQEASDVGNAGSP